jgi:hypothetical protein
MRRRSLGLLGFGLTIVLAHVGGTRLKADWSEDFSGATFSQPWVVLDDAGNRPPDATIINPDSDNLQLIADFQQQQAGNFDLFAAAIVGLGEEQYSFTDVKVQATVFAATGHNFGGAVARGNNDSFVLARMTAAGNSGYVFNLDYGTGDIDLVRADNAPAGIIGLENGSLPGFDPAQSYVLELRVEDTTLIGRVLQNGNELASIITEDTTYASGWSGVGGSVNDNLDPPALTTIAVGFDDVTSTSLTPPPRTFDLTGDSRVDRADVALFTTDYYGTTDSVPPLSAADFSDDGFVGLRDAMLLRDAFSAPSPAGVPEPNTILAALAAVTVLLSRRATVRSRRPKSCPLTAADGL